MAEEGIIGIVNAEFRQLIRLGGLGVKGCRRPGYFESIERYVVTFDPDITDLERGEGGNGVCVIPLYPRSGISVSQDKVITVNTLQAAVVAAYKDVTVGADVI